jgi:hypothetical protein
MATKAGTGIKQSLMSLAKNLQEQPGLHACSDPSHQPHAVKAWQVGGSQVKHGIEHDFGSSKMPT